MTVYILFYDVDYGGPESWNTFHTPCEVFSTPEERAKRIKELKAENPEYEFHKISKKVK